MYAKIKDDPNWYPVLDVINIKSVDETVYVLDGRGRVVQEDIERIDFD